MNKVRGKTKGINRKVRSGMWLSSLIISILVLFLGNNWILPKTLAQTIPVPEQPVINAHLSWIKNKTRTEFDPTPVEGGPAGTFTITAPFENTVTVPVSELSFSVHGLTGGNLLLNADDGAGGDGSKLTVPFVGDYSDRILKEIDSFSVDFIIGLASRKRFRFFVDAMGTPLGLPVVDLPGASDVPNVDLSGDADQALVLFDPYPVARMIDQSLNPFLELLSNRFSSELEPVLEELDQDIKASNLGVLAVGASWGFPNKLEVIVLTENATGESGTIRSSRQTMSSIPQPPDFGLERTDFFTTFADEESQKDTALTLFGTDDVPREVEPMLSFSVDGEVVTLLAEQVGSLPTATAGAIGAIRKTAKHLGLGTVLLRFYQCRIADTSPPTIQTNPSPNTHGWHNDEIMVTINDNCPYAGEIAGIHFWSVLGLTPYRENFKGEREIEALASDAFVTEEWVVGIDTQPPVVNKTTARDKLSGILKIEASETASNNCKGTGVLFDASAGASSWNDLTQPPNKGNISETFTAVSCSPCATGDCSYKITATDFAGNEGTFSDTITCPIDP